MNSFPIHNSIGTALGTALQEVVLACQQEIAANELTVEVDVESGLDGYVLTSELQSTLRHLLSRACGRSPNNSQILITAIDTVSGVEIEVADEGQMILDGRSESDVELSSVRAFRCRETWATNLSRGNVFCTNCPQGGIAWTIVIPSAMQAQHAA